ncbi:zinc finger protein 644 [Cottoperca gobio]|uniref:Zinc finger protein 644-like n=1 Tax=Cottoperca gobio TaxID=56716 RepID=A0A6J2PKT9_COTGO|nr:zinc finger protein 644-like [Cottoperca gobio]XP_029285984.1 zinc finger protein 644-like [Cottoperca gobio]
MSDLKPNAQEDKDVESVSDRPGRTQEPLQSHTFSLKNNAAGLSSDEHENPLNGTQPNPFVYSSVPAVPHAGNSLPSGALVNGPGSHPTSEVHCVLNKGTVLSNNVLDAVWQAEKDTSPEVLPPPSELQSDAWKNTAGPVEETLATQPGVNTPPSHSEETESKLAYSTLSGADSAEEMHISQPSTKQTMKTRSRRDVEWSESSSDDYDDAEVIRWDSARECYLHNDRRLETEVMHQRDSKHNTHVKSMSDSLEKVNNSLNHTYRRFCFCTSNDVRNVDIANKDDSSGTQSDIKYSVVPLKDLSTNTASDSEHHIYSTAQEGCNEGNDPEDEDNFSSKVEQLKTEQVEQEPLFFSCTICNVHFKEKRHFHRHMMYHLGKHNQVNSENVSQPFICRECGRLFCDSNSLMRHIIIHQDRLEKLMEEIKGLKNTELEHRGTKEQCPHCVFGCKCPKISVQHATTHDNLKHYYFCEECNYITLTQQALEAHLHVAHLDTHQPQYRKVNHTNDAEEADHVQLQRKMGFFSCRDKVIERHSELKHLRSHCGNYKKVGDQPKIATSNPNLLTLGETDHFPHCSNRNGDIYFQKSNEITVNSAQFKCHVGCTKNMLSPSLWRVDRHGKLLLQKNVDVATDLTCVEEESENNDCEAFGSSKQANCPVTADILLLDRNLKLDQMFSQGGKNNPASESLQAQANQNSLSMREMSTPLHGAIDKMNGNISARLCQRLKKLCADKELEKGCEGSVNFSDDTCEATGSFLESQNVRNPYARRYFRKRQRCSAKDQSPHVHNDEDDGDEDCSDIEQLVIKEEFIETTVCEDSPESPCMSTSDSFDVFPTPGVEHKSCPYCPAMFQSGVGLSNHVRGHLHRVGLSYNARHMVSPEQVALHDHQPRIRRRIPCGTRKMRKAVKPETQGAHTCPLCCGWFDTKTGLSNHVRGHLKRIGRSVTSTSKSPLCILNELLQDKKEHQNILQVLNQSQFPSRSFVSQKLISNSGLVLMRMGIPVNIQYEMRSPRPILDSFVPKQEAEAEAQKGPKASSSTLVELLKMRQESMELTARHKQEAYATRELCDLTKDYMEETQTTRVEPNWAHEECDSNKICIQCNDTFPRLPGHLPAYAQRKRIAIFEDPGYDFKPKKPRPGLKKKILPSLNAEIYTLTCRFCDLVFQGPLSIQEDWIKHLQRHLLHTSVPQSGTAMVEVLGLHHRVHMSCEQPGLE